MMGKNWGPRVRRTTNPTQIDSDMYTGEAKKMENPAFCTIPNYYQDDTEQRNNLITKFRSLRRQLHDIESHLKKMGINTSSL